MADARAILRNIADELRRTPRPAMTDPAEIARNIASTADQIEGVVAISRLALPARDWRAPLSSGL